MKRLFLSSLFKDVSQLLKDFAHEELVGKTVTFIPTAALPDQLYFHIEYSKTLLSEMGLFVDELEITTAAYTDIVKKLTDNDYIYIAGGNTFFLLQELNKSGAGTVIKEQVNAGKLYIGESAGAIIAAPNIEYARDTDNPLAAPHLTSFTALNMIDFYPVPHYQDDTLKEAIQIVLGKYGAALPLVPFSNSQAILVRGNDMVVVSQNE